MSRSAGARNGPAAPPWTGLAPRIRGCSHPAPIGTAACLLAAVLLTPAFAEAEMSQPQPDVSLQERVEVRLTAERSALRQSIGHYGLVFDVTPKDFERFRAQVLPRVNGGDVVMGGIHGVELHGGGVLGLIAEYSTRGSSPARLDQQYTFPLLGRALALQAIYDAHAAQLYLPVPGTKPAEIAGALPATPQLPRMHFAYAPSGRAGSTDVDAFTYLELLLRFEDDLNRSWSNGFGQRLTAEIALGQAWERYVATATAEEEFEDHSYLHLPQILLEYSRRNSDRDPNDIKRRFLSVELGRTEYGGYEASESLAHYADSLAFLLSDPRIEWTEPEEKRVVEWLARLEHDWPSSLEGIPLQHLAHLLRALRAIELRDARGK